VATSSSCCCPHRHPCRCGHRRREDPRGPRRPFHLAGLRVEVSSSIGVALYPDHGADEAALTLHADAAMYAAKHCGRDRVTVFSLAA
jgi:GGDEF domain-containing protein